MKKSVLFLLLLSCLGFKAHGQAKSESTWLIWEQWAEVNGIINTSKVKFYYFDLFPDSTVKQPNYSNTGAFIGYGYVPWHSAGEILDPYTTTFDSSGTPYYLNFTTPYTLDSIDLHYYIYRHAIADTTIKDTLVFDFYNENDVALGRYSNGRPVVVDSFRPQTTTSWKFAKEVKYVLKMSDTGYQIPTMHKKIYAGVNISPASVTGYSVTFKPGYKYSKGDTLEPVNAKGAYKKLDLFSILITEVDDTSTTSRDASFNMSELANNDVKYSTNGWDSTYIWGTAWGGNGFYYYLYHSGFHISTVNQESDAGVTKILFPSASNVCSGAQDVKVVIKNFASDTLTSVNITDSIYGGTALHYAWTGSLPKDSTDTVDLGSYTFSAGSVFMKAWTWEPNGGKDSFAGDDTSTVSFTAVALPAANTAGNQNICTGGSVAIGASAIAGDTYSWSSLPPGFSSTSANPVVNPSGNTQYSVTVTDTATGCSATSALVTVTVHSLPLLNVANAKVCTGDSTYIGPTSQSGVTYTWASSPKGFTSTVATPLVKPKLSTTYYIKAINSYSCSDSDSVIVTVVPFPTAIPGSNQTVCLGDSATIGATSVSGLSYAWVSNPGTFTSSLSNPKIAPKVTTTYSLTVVNSTGCSTSASVVITVSSVPDLAGKNQKLCSGDSVTIGDTMSGITYTWSSTGPSGYSSSAEQPVVSPALSTTYYLYATNALNCYNFDSTVVTVFQTPSVPLSKNKVICSGSSAKIGVSNVSGVSSYDWSSSPAGFKSTVSNPTVSPTANTTYYLTASTANCSVTDTEVVTLDSLPTVSAGANDSIYYSTIPVPLSGFSPKGGKWTGTGVDSAGLFTPSVAGLGFVTLKYSYTNAGGCTATATRTVKVIDGDDAGISAITSPATSITKAGTYPITVTLKNFGVSVLGSVQIDWSVNTVPQQTYYWTGALTTGSTASVTLGSYAFSSIEPYNITAYTDSPNAYIDINDNNDTASENLNITALSGIENSIASRFDVNIYPNPFTASTNITYTLETSQNVSIEIYDINGKAIVNNTENNEAPGAHQFTFGPSLYGASSGMYLVKLIIGDVQVAKTVVMVK